MRLLRLLALPLLLLASCPRPAAAAGKVDRKAGEALAVAWAKARPKTAFVDWDPKARAEILARAKALGTLPEGAKDEVVEILWKAFSVKNSLSKIISIGYNNVFKLGSPALCFSLESCPVSKWVPKRPAV